MLPKRFLTERLELRPPGIGDFEAWLHAQRAMHPAVNRFDRGPAPEGRRTRRHYLAYMARMKRMARTDFTYKFVVFERRTGLWLGSVDLHPFVRRDFQWGNLGYAILNPYWGKGYASEAARKALEIGFRHVGLHRLEASTTLDNKASIGVMRAIGMKKECVRERFMFDGGHWRDMVVYALTAEDLGIRVRPTAAAPRPRRPSRRGASA